jgi:hypothetical protein
VTSFPFETAACDLDGTIIFGSDISPENYEAVQTLKHSGVRVVLASGRNFHHMTKYYQELGLTSPVVSSDGALVTGANGEIICERPMPKRVSAQILKEAQKRQITCLCFFRQGIYTTSVFDWNEGMERHREIGRHFRHSSVNAMSKRNIYKTLLYSVDPQVLDAMQANVIERFGDAVDAIRNNPNSLEFVAKGVSKVSALNVLAQLCSFDPKKSAAFGDGVNDKGMFGWAGYSVCMHHGHPSALVAAAMVAPKSSAQTNFAAAVQAMAS